MSVEPVSVLILAGGRSRRMGRDKVWLDLDGQPLVERVARRVLPLAGEIIFSTGDPKRFSGLRHSLGVPVQLVADEHPGAGPLGGIYAGLKSARHDLVLALATDMPFLNLDLLRYMCSLAKGYDAVVPLLPKPGGGQLMREPLHAFYRRTCLPAITRHLDAGDYQAFCFLPEVRTRDVLQADVERLDPERASFFNINTPEDWAWGEKRLNHDEPQRKARWPEPSAVDSAGHPGAFGCDVGGA